MTILDNDVPELSIADATSENITEGETITVDGKEVLKKASFPVTASFSPDEKLTVRYSVTQPGTGYNFISSIGTRDAELDFETGKTSANIEVEIFDNGRVDTDGIVRVTLLPDNQVDGDGNPAITYTVSSVTGENIGEVTSYGG